MYYFIATLLLLQFYCAIDARQRGYPFSFIAWIILFPLLGSIAYFLIEIAPELYHRYLQRRFQQYLPKESIEVALRALENQTQRLPTIENQHRLAKLYLKMGQPKKALALLEPLLKSNFSSCPYLLSDKAKALFALGQFQETKFLLTFLMQNNYQSDQIKLLHARTLSHLGEWQSAIEAFEGLEQCFAGLEASYYFYQYLCEINQHARANQVLHRMQNRFNRLPRNFRAKEKEWLKQADKVSH